MKAILGAIGGALLVVGFGMTSGEVQQTMRGEGGTFWGRHLPGEEEPDLIDARIEEFLRPYLGEGWVDARRRAEEERRAWTPGPAEPVGWCIAALGAGLLVAGVVGSKKSSE